MVIVTMKLVQRRRRRPLKKKNENMSLCTPGPSTFTFMSPNEPPEPCKCAKYNGSQGRAHDCPEKQYPFLRTIEPKHGRYEERNDIQPEG
jgi:hypothetical protein